MELSSKLETKADPLEASFDAVLIAEETEQYGQAIAALRGDVDGLKGQVDAIGKVAARPVLAGNLDGAKGMASSPAAQDFVAKYLRRGEQAGVELKSFSGASGPEGGFAVPQEIDALIGATLKDISPIRSIATVVQTGTAGYRKLVTTGGTPSGWVSETAGRPETDTPDFNEIAPPSGELYANPAASQAMLDDAAFDVEAWLADEIAREFARAEGAAFVGGSGVNQPRGFLNAAVTDESDDVRAFGSLQYVASGSAGSFASEDVLVDLVHTLRPAYRQGAAFVMNSSTLAQIRKFKTADGAFLWQPSLASGQPATLLGYPVVEAEDMPDIAADSLAIAFGNFRAGYLIAERRATHILRDPFTNKPFVHFYATKRVGGQLMNSEAIKLMQFSAS
ncbi:MAG: phage major capsid protein [Sphingomonadales bacterium]|nr:phage major capsid protein [Sphingomonadales bacterium]PIX65913.1 MAG: phage major capsid protein [Sphingomonadales bacterium CG_4_10_14_3_um_filter_58_15]NCO49307.1 phage major capsid protein [Sphingomonadales bacterium]NCO99479.1 phage major capsid protein [Sphingomonadales bacterium]NCP27811.1 phage major capsid protein [Sphingomonadales bacterium]